MPKKSVMSGLKALHKGKARNPLDLKGAEKKEKADMAGKPKPKKPMMPVNGITRSPKKRKGA